MEGKTISRTIILFQPLTNIFDRGKALPTQPLSLLSAVRCLHEAYNVILINACSMPQWRSRLEEEILKGPPLCFGTTSITGNQVFSTLEAVRIVSKHSEVPVVWGGIHGTLFPDLTLREAPVNIIVRKEGEETFPEVLHALEEERGLADIPGISYQRDGKIFHNPERPPADLETLPEVPYELIQGPVYFLAEGKPTLYFETSRGCFSQCAYCYNQAYHQRKWRKQSAQKVLERVHSLKVKFPGIQHLSLVDDNYFVSIGRVKEIAEGLVRMKSPVTYQVQGAHTGQIHRMDVEDLRLMARSGCVRLDMGVESGSPRILEEMKKKIHPHQVREINQRLGRLGIRPWFNFMAGFPGETSHDIQETRALIFQLLGDNPGCLISPIYPLAPYPGTELFQRAVELGFEPPRKLQDWKDYHLANDDLPWLNRKRRKEIAAMYFLSIFIDDKLMIYDTKLAYRLLARLYRPFARFRLKRGFYFGMLELVIFKRFFDIS